MSKPKNHLEIYDCNRWQAFTDYRGLTTARGMTLAPLGAGKCSYVLNDNNRQDEMLMQFISIKTEGHLLSWLQEYGLPDARTNWSPGELLNYVSIMRWLVDLLNAGLDETYEQSDFLTKHLVIDPYRSNQIGLSQLQRDQMIPPISPDEESTNQLIQLKIEKFDREYTTIGFRHDFLPRMAQVTILRGWWKGTPEQLRLIARIAVAQKAAFEMSGIPHGASLTVEVTFDSTTGFAALMPVYSVKNPWQAMNYALFKRALQNKVLNFCKCCGRAFAPIRRSARYCSTKCKDDFNNRARLANSQMKKKSSKRKK